MSTTQELLDAYDAAKARHSEASKAQTAADTAARQAWDAMNDARIALFSAQNPEIRDEVESINRQAEDLDKRVKRLRKKVEERGLRLPQYYLKLP